MHFDLKDVLALTVLTASIVMTIWGRVRFAKKSDVYNQDGTTKFPTVRDCDKNVDAHTRALDEIKQLVAEGERRRNETRTEITSQLLALTKEVSDLGGQVKHLTKTGGVVD